MIMAPSLSLVSHRFRRQQTATKAERRKGNLFFYLMGLVLLAFLCSLFYIWSRIQIVNVGYEINRDISIKEKLLEENKRLTLEMATLKSPVRLESLAKNEYRMDLPQKSQIIHDGSFTEQVPAAKKTAISLTKPNSSSPTKKSAGVAESGKPVAKPVAMAATSGSLKKATPLVATSKTSTRTATAQKAQMAKKETSVSRPSPEKAATALPRTPKPQPKVVTLADLAEVNAQPRR